MSRQGLRYDLPRPARDRGARKPPRRRNYGWAELMRRVFEIDVLVCPRCSGALRILAHIHPPEATRAILDHLRLPAWPPPLARWPDAP